MRRKILNLIPVLLLLALSAFPQGRGGSRGGSQGGSQSGQQGQGQGQHQGSVQAGAGQMERKQIHMTSQQRDQVQNCDRLADGIRKQARTMGKSAGGNSPAGQLSEQRNQIRNKVREMEQEHERLMNGIDPTQQQDWQEQIRNMNQLRQQLHTQLQQLDADVDGANPDSKRVNERSREIERTMSQWRKQYSGMYSESGL